MKPIAFSILRRLSDGAFHSGEDLGLSLARTRAGIWIALREIKTVPGLKLSAVRGRGYRLMDPLAWLDKKAVVAALGTEAGEFKIEIVDCVESTNAALTQKAALGAPQGCVLAAELQTAGRGRRGRKWHANLGGALTFSVLWRFFQGAGQLSGLSLAVGVALVRALEDVGVTGVQLKWPNDLVCGGKKLGGILIEAQGDMLGPTAAVIGIGLNFKLNEEVVSLIGRDVTDIFAMTGLVPDRNLALGAILRRLGPVLEEFASHGFGALRKEWLRHCAHHNRTVCAVLPDGTIERGTAVGVADDGALLLETRSGRKRLNVGEISLRSARRGSAQ